MKLAFVALIVLLGYGYGDAQWTNAGMPHNVESVTSVGVSNGQFGIWITTDKDEVYWRKTESGPWLKAHQRPLSYVSVAQNQAWGVYKGKIYKTTIKSNVLPWARQRGPPLKQISVSDNGNVWGIHLDGTLWRKKSTGFWTRGANPNIRFQSVSVGWSGVWAVGRYGVVWFLKGSYGDNLPRQPSWVRIQGALIQVHSGEDFVIGVNKERDVYRRSVASDDNAGTDWEQAKAKASYVTSGSYKVFGIRDGALVKAGALQY